MLNSYKNFVFKYALLLMPIFLVLVFFVAKNVQAASYWVTDPTDCPSLDTTNFPGQNCDNLDICGDISGIAQCYDTTNINVPSSLATSSISYYAGINAGFVMDCYATDSSAGSGDAYCDNNTDWWCNASSTCTGINLETNCTANVAGNTTCGSCLSGFQYCDGSDADADGCEVETGVTEYGSGLNANYGAGCTATCDIGYFDCNGEGPGLTDGCEIAEGATCVNGIGLIGAYNGCSCGVSSSYFETGVEVRYATSAPLLWGTQYGSGDLMNLSASSTSGGVFRITNDGRVGIGTSTLNTNDMLTVGMTANNQFIVNKSGAVTEGTWQGGVIGLQYGGTGLDLSAETGFLHVSGGAVTASSTIDITKTDLAATSTGVLNLLTMTGNTLTLNALGDWGGTVEGVDISTLAANDANDWDELSDMSLAQGSIYVGDGTGSPAANSFLFVDTNGKVGIGTSSPSAKLTVVGDILIGGTDRYLNFGVATGTTGYGIRDSSGTIQVKNASGVWTAIGAGSTAMNDLSDVDTTGTATGSLVYFNGTSWEDVATSSLGLAASGHNHDATYLQIANNLSDLNSSSTARTNLGIHNIYDYGINSVGLNGQLWQSSGSSRGSWVSTSSLGWIDDIDFSTNGIMVRTASGAYTTRTATGTVNEIVVLNGDGVLGNPTLSLPDAVYLGANGIIGRDSDNYIDFSTDNQIGFNASGTQLMLLDASGNFMIGTSTPGAKLTVMSNTGSQLRLSYDADTYVDFTVASNGELTFAGSTDNGSVLYIGDNTAEDVGIIMDGNVNDYWMSVIDSDDSFRIGTSSMIGSSSVFTMLNNGNIGIGTTSPSARLTVWGDFLLEGTNRFLSFGTTTGAGGYGLRDNSGVMQMKSLGGSWYTPAGISADGTMGQVAYFGANGNAISGTSSLFIASDGNIGINTVTPTSALEVNGDAYVAGVFTAATTTTSYTQTKTVAKQGADYVSIQSAIDALTCSSTAPCLVRVMPGVYSEQITINNKSYIDIVSAGGPEVTKINPSGVTEAITISGSSGNVRIEGFEINN